MNVNPVGIFARGFETLLGCLALASLLLVPTSGCRSTTQPEGELRHEMVGLQATVRELYRFAWDREAFFDAKNEAEIRSLLATLDSNYHKIEEASFPEDIEPGFRVGLQRQHDMIAEINRAFGRGELSFVHRRLRSLAGTCVGCHSRFRVATDFIGPPPPRVPDSEARQFAAAEYMVATRQFDKASELLFPLARTIGTDFFPGGIPFEALKLWLLVEIRVKNRPAHAARKLRELLPETEVDPFLNEVVLQWVKDLDMLAQHRAPQQALLSEARGLVDRARLPDVSVKQDVKALVRTLRATASPCASRPPASRDSA